MHYKNINFVMFFFTAHPSNDITPSAIKDANNKDIPIIDISDDDEVQ